MTTRRHPRLPFGLLAAMLLLAACGDDRNSLRGGRGQNASGGASDDVVVEALQCTEAAPGRSYVLFDGSKLEQSRRDEGAGINHARFKPFSVLAGEYRRVLGVTPERVDEASASFDEPPPRWYSEPTHSGVSLNAMFAMSFGACTSAVRADATLAQPPSDATAEGYCRSLMRKAWSRSPSPDEIDGCVDLATTKLDDEPDARRRWSYVCASILSSSHFLTF